MIQTSIQLKALVRNRAKGDSNKAQMIFSAYVMGRFLERLSLSPYRENLVLKGGALVAAMVGLDNRSTQDLDATIQSLPLSIENAQRIIEEIVSLPLNDGMTFEIASVSTIMDEADYTDVRIMLDTTLDAMQIPLRMDISTGDVLSPNEVEYSYPLLFEDRTVPILAYNLETVLAEKVEILLARGVANTRMRDFYDLYTLATTYGAAIDAELLRQAFLNTSHNRGSLTVIAAAPTTLQETRESPALMALWQGYQKRFDYAADLSWEAVMAAVTRLIEIAVK